MIRNVVMFRLRPGADLAEVAAVQTGLRAMDLPGTLSYTIGDDLGLRDGNWSFAVVSDFTDTEAYRAYDADAGHNDLRARLAPHVEEISRVQFELDGD
jgi:hypothetical protein